jgi:hypothetical protein
MEKGGATMKKVELEGLRSVELSGEMAFGFVCGGGCQGIFCLCDDGHFYLWLKP